LPLIKKTATAASSSAISSANEIGAQGPDADPISNTREEKDQAHRAILLKGSSRGFEQIFGFSQT
jgi:hypothetical protein